MTTHSALAHPRTRSQQIAYRFDIACRYLLIPSLLSLWFVWHFAITKNDSVLIGLATSCSCVAAFGCMLWVGYYRYVRQKPIGISPGVLWCLTCIFNMVVFVLLCLFSMMTLLWPSIIWPLIAIFLSLEAWGASRTESASPSMISLNENE